MAISTNPRPLPIIASDALWNFGEQDSVPVLVITNGRGRMLIDRSDFPKIIDAMTTVVDMRREVQA